MKLRDRIVDCMIALCNRDGAHRVTTNHIIEELSISPGTLYYHFKNKEEIIREIFQRISGEFRTLYSFDQKITVDRIIENIRESFRVLHRYRFFYTELPMLLDRDDNLRESYRQNYREKQKLHSALYDHMAAGGILHLPESAEEKRALLRNLWIVTDLWFSFVKTAEGGPDEASAEEGARHYLFTLLPHLLPPYREEIRQSLINATPARKSAASRKKS